MTDKVNLNTLYESKLLLPWYEPTQLDAGLKKGRPLYAVSSRNAVDDDNGELSELASYPGWENEAKTKYSSPTNVRRLFLGVKEVYIHTYKPIIKDGRSMDKLSYKKGLGTDFENAIKSILAYQHGGDIAYSSDFTEIEGQPLKFIYKPWIMSNIEEIYIETGLLFAAGFRNKIGVNNVVKIYESNNVAVLKDKIPQVFKSIMGDKAFKEGLTKMPRLKYLGIVDSVSAFESTKYSNTKDASGKILSSVEAMKMATNQPNTSYCVYDRAPAVGLEDNNQFKVRSYYKFDNEYLSEFARSLFRDVDASQKEKADIAQAVRVQQEQASKNELELELDTLFAQDAFKAQIAFNSLMMSNNKETRQAIYSSFTNSGKTKYKQLFSQFGM